MTLRKALFLVASLSIAAAQAAAGQTPGCNKTLTIAFFDWQPYHYRDENGEPTGLDVEILKATFGAAGCPFKLTVMPWKRTLLAIKFGTIDGAMGASVKEDRQEYAWFSRPYRRETMVIFTRNSDEFNGLETLEEVVGTDRRIGVMLGSWYGPSFDALYQRDRSLRTRLSQTADYEILFNGLFKGRLDLVFNDLFNGVHMLKKMGKLDDVSIHPLILNDDYTHFILSKLTVTRETVDAVNKAIEAFQSTDDFTRVLHRYVPPEQLRYMPYR